MRQDKVIQSTKGIHLNLKLLFAKEGNSNASVWKVPRHQQSPLLHYSKGARREQSYLWSEVLAR